MDIHSLNDIGARGLVVFDGTKYYYSLEEDWRKYKIEAPSGELQGLADCRAVVARATTTLAVFVNLSEMEGVADPKAPYKPGDAEASNGAEEGAIVILHENGSFFGVANERLYELVEGAEGDAGVVVNRGTIVASIPQNDIPSGTWCVLVNLPSIVRHQPRAALRAVGQPRASSPPKAPPRSAKAKAR
jgi:hypothetical protein